jgi:hypothetical protein
VQSAAMEEDLGGGGHGCDLGRSREGARDGVEVAGQDGMGLSSPSPTRSCMGGGDGVEATGRSKRSGAVTRAG